MADTAFEERLARINSGQGFVAEGLLGNGDLNTIRKRQEKGRAPTPATMGVPVKKRLPVKRVLIAALLGVVSFFGGSLGAFHATNSVPSEFDQYRPLVEALGPVGMSGLLAMLLLYISGFRSMWLVGAMVLGFFATHYAEPHMAQTAPVLWSQMYSPEHADALKFKAIAQSAQINAVMPAGFALPTGLSLPEGVSLPVDLGLPSG
ncbi:hypothetical protein C8N43_0492 [Litoreibacter ponti]|uniref:Uncharacterized protein n=1 Tax=Litoreibacter ponti TaxID=1510457 RepID=A0A2T6BIG2_9RHOB|nr:hypothetical protein [Litoreibacter ponti]PTX55845.1 hypothetical protein C8N43_0492 [Litoreibacter ponti]